jgi:hypothetical protein
MEAAFRQARDTLDSFIPKIETSHPDRILVAVKVSLLYLIVLLKSWWMELPTEMAPFTESWAMKFLPWN